MQKKWKEFRERQNYNKMPSTDQAVSEAKRQRATEAKEDQQSQKERAQGAGAFILHNLLNMDNFRSKIKVTEPTKDGQLKIKVHMPLYEGTRRVAGSKNDRALENALLKNINDLLAETGQHLKLPISKVTRHMGRGYDSYTLIFKEKDLQLIEQARDTFVANRERGLALRSGTFKPVDSSSMQEGFFGRTAQESARAASAATAPSATTPGKAEESTSSTAPKPFSSGDSDT